MNKILSTSLFALCITFSLTAQQWNGNNNTTDPIGRTGNVAVGVTSPVAKLNIVNNSGWTSSFRRAFEGKGNALFLLRKSRGAIGAETAVQNGDYLGQIRGEGYDGSNYKTAGWIRIAVDGTPATDIVPGQVIFATTTSGGVVTERMHIKSDGNVGIGTSNPQEMLAVNGNITCKEVEVTLNGWADYVFDKNYVLTPLEEVEEFISENGHLPDVPTAINIKQNGVKVGEMESILLKKIEELTLHIIELNKRIKKLEQRK